MSVDDAALDIRNDFEAWARVSARLLRRPPGAAAGVIRDVGVESSWREIDARWYDVLVADIEAGRLDRVVRYRAICSEVLEARATSGAAVPSPLDLLRPPPLTATLSQAQQQPTPRFAKQLAPVGVKPKPPSRQQVSTSQDMRGAMDQELATERALSWPQERYAWLCAQLEHTPARAEEIWNSEGIQSVHARSAVKKSWERRLDADPRARNKHDELMKSYKDALKKPLV